MKEIRNQFGRKLMMALAQSDTFRVGSVAHLRVGHTHEDIDALFSICTTFLRSAQSIETPRDLQRLLIQRVGPPFSKRGQDFQVEIMDVVAGFEDSVINCFLYRP